MAKMSFEFSFDGKQLAKMARDIQSECFIAISDFDALETELNILGIPTNNGETEED